MKRAQKRSHEVGNVYLKTLAGLPRETWQEWQLVKRVDRMNALPHVIMQEVGGKTTRTVAISVLNDPHIWAMRDI
ncbi:MAG: hypothetical protein ACREFL_20165 [Stellaceae bacterium]